MKKSKLRLQWRKRWCSDKSGHWYAAKVPFVGWEYIIDVHEYLETFKISVFLSKHASDATFITDKFYKKLESAMNACENHLEKTKNDFKKLS